jgi:hypothetical protein
LHSLGIALGILIGKAGQASARRIAQVGGSAIAVAGVALLAGLI